MSSVSKKAAAKAAQAKYGVTREVQAMWEDAYKTALEEAQKAVLKHNETGEEVELSPRPIEIRKQQHDYIEQHGLKGVSVGEEPNRRIKII